MVDKNSGFFDKGGREINSDLVVKPSLCKSCKKNNDPAEEVFCILNRLGQQETGAMFRCTAYEAETI